MDLENFIAESVRELIAGVRKGQELALKEGAIICPRTEGYESVEFDVAVTATTDKETKGKAGLRVCSVGVGGEHSGEETHSTVTRVKFSVLVSYPLPPGKAKPAAEIIAGDIDTYAVRTTG